MKRECKRVAVFQPEFREDLLYRLNLITIHIAALRDRAPDIPLLATHFISNIGNVYRSNLSISERALKWLQSQNWPGNVRQLKHLIERTVLISGQDRLDPSDFEAALEMEPKESARDSLPIAGEATIPTDSTSRSKDSPASWPSSVT